MAFKLDSVVPWGRNMEEYREMFLLDDNDMKLKIAGFGDGPACFNAQATKAGFNVKSFDPIYQFSKDAIENRINEVREIVMKQMAENQENYEWDKIKTLDELENIRMSAMKVFLEDFEKGKTEGRYIYHELPNVLPYKDKEFDIGLSSHFLLMYTELGYDFHISAIDEMLRVCKEIRIFPLCDLNSDSSDMIDNVINHYSENYKVEIKETTYRFQKNANKLLIISS